MRAVPGLGFGPRVAPAGKTMAGKSGPPEADANNESLGILVFAGVRFGIW